MADSEKKIYKENLYYTIPLLGFIAIFAKIIEHFFLPAKYYYDNNRILGMINDPEFSGKWPGSYEVAADFFRKINIFHCTTFLQWSILLGILFNILLILLFTRNKGLDIKQTFFALMCTGILNIYIFNVGKDAIQILIFIMLYIVINLNISKFIKIAGCFAILYWESTFYRNYYIIIAFFFLSIIMGIFWLRRKRKRVSVAKVIMIIFLLYTLVFIFLATARTFMHGDYAGVMNCKAGVDVMQANSMIDDKIEHNGNLMLFMENYVINSIRMAFPIELLKSGAFYLPFLVFEIFLIYYLFQAILRLYKMSFNQVIALSIFVAYFMGSVLFEPDFGSFVRHEAATFPILYILVFNPDNWRTASSNKVKGRIQTS